MTNSISVVNATRCTSMTGIFEGISESSIQQNGNDFRRKRKKRMIGNRTNA